MDRVLLEAGEYAKIPYSFDNLGIRVFSAEELCYVLKENAFLLDKELVDRKLVRWIDEIIKLPKLAQALYPLLNKRTSAGTFAGIILDYVKLYDRETIRNIEERFNKGANLSTFEKLKTRVDYMVTNGRYASALVEYDSLLAQLPEEEKNLTAKIQHNKGVALCGLFLFDEAANHFKMSYDILPNVETMIEFLAAKRLSMEEEDYISFAAGFPECYDESLELEKRMREFAILWEDTEEKQALEERLSWKRSGEMAKYYMETDKKVQELKSNYRASI